MAIRTAGNGRSGIYEIRNIVNNNIYIGSAVDFNKRWYLHLKDLTKNAHSNSHLQKAWNKYGKENFVFNKLEICKREDLIRREQFHLDLKKPSYNICKIAGSWLGVKHRAETILKMKRPKTEEHKNKLRKPKTEEHKKKLSISRMGMPSSRKGVKCLQSTIEKMRLANLGKKYSDEVNKKKGSRLEKNGSYGTGNRILQYDLSGNFIREFISGSEINRELGFEGSNIIKYCRMGKQIIYGYKWKLKKKV